MAKKKASEGSIVNTDKYEYGRIAVRGKDGKVHHSSGNGDAVQKAMLLHTVVNGKSIGSVIRDNGLTAKFKDHDAEKSPGLVRMSLGVALRALIKNGTPVTIGDVEIKSLKQAIALPKVEKTARIGAGERAASKKAKAVKKAAKPRARKAKAEPAAEQQASAQ